jgi:hypothetical protein
MEAARANAVCLLCTLQVWHVKLLWFAGVSCHLLWFTFAKVSALPARAAQSTDL